MCNVKKLSILSVILFFSSYRVANATQRLKIGGEFSILYYYPEDQIRPHSFILHIGRLDVTAYISNHTTVTYSNNLGEQRRLYAEFFLLPLKGTLKIGKFKVPFGLVLEDHTSLLEDNIGLGIYRENVGVGLSISPLIFDLSTGIFNSARTGLYHIDTKREKLFTTTLSARLWGSDFGIAYLRNPATEINKTFIEGYTRVPLNHFSFLSKCIIGEIRKNRVIGYSTLLEWYPIPLLIPYIQYELLDQNRDIAQNSLSRVALGIKYDFLPNTRLRIIYYINKENPEIRNNLWVIMLSLWY
ncbi:MAG: hypothetical protein QMD71_07565 [bacterium]|nr:hypothetical protein [bacterium]